jgi:osmotically inducible protein OsmC
MSARTGEAEWLGTLHDGAGRLTVGPQRWSAPYTFASRFGDEPDTNPEELIAAAHAGCFSMALSAELGKAGHDPQSVETDATVHIDKEGEGFAIKRIALRSRARVPGISDEEFQQIAEGAKQGCPVSKALAAVDSIELDAQLKG